MPNFPEGYVGLTTRNIRGYLIDPVKPDELERFGLEGFATEDQAVKLVTHRFTALGPSLGYHDPQRPWASLSQQDQHWHLSLSASAHNAEKLLGMISLANRIDNNRIPLTNSGRGCWVEPNPARPRHFWQAFDLMRQQHTLRRTVESRLDAYYQHPASADCLLIGLAAVNVLLKQPQFGRPDRPILV